jgi:hypothetical protein
VTILTQPLFGKANNQKESPRPRGGRGGGGGDLPTVDLVELSRDAAAEQPASTARRHRPRLQVLRVAPHDVAERALVWDLAQPVDRAYLGEWMRGGWSE